MTILSAQVRSEIIKINRTALLVLSGLGGLVALAIGLHAFGLSASSLASGDRQLGILVDVGSNLGSVFAALLGALIFTGEFRTGTIRPTLLASPRRGRVFLAKAAVVLGLGVVTGIITTGIATAVAVLGFDIRGIIVHLRTDDIAQLVGGVALGGALWAVIGLAVGCLVRSQVPTIVGLLAWILFVENVLVDLPAIHQYAPGALVQALAGSTRDGVLTSPAAAGALLLAYTLVGGLAAASRFRRQDVA